MYEAVKLWQRIPGECAEEPVLECYLPENRSCKAAVVIFPGGGYAMRAEHEGKGYAEFFAEHGIAAFVCQYRVYPHQFPLPLLDARRAVQYVRHHAQRFGIGRNSIYVMGSSAGGHLAAMTSTYTEPIPVDYPDAIDAESFRPDGQILCYPVIKLLGKEVAHLGSGKCLLGERQAEMGEELSPDLIATADAPKAFIWHTFQDGLVSAINSLDYARRLRQVEVPVELHIYPDGHHGLGLALDTPHTCRWSQQLLSWLHYYEGNTP